MRILFFGTYDERTHPRVRVLREGLDGDAREVRVANEPLGFSTADRVRVVQRPWTAPALAIRLLVRWVRLWRSTRGQDPEVVVVGYLGQFDVHLARRRFPNATLVLDHMVGLGDTVRDRGLDRGRVGRFLDRVDRAALGAADLVVVDTEEQLATLPGPVREHAIVVPVGAPRQWFSARADVAAGEPLRIIFYGLYTPLQGAPIIGAALRSIPGAPLACTMVGRGQDLAATRAAVGDDGRVTWTEWIDPDDLPGVVAGHDVCLGIFGDGAKAQRVVPNKVYQGAAAGCAVLTSDTPPQRRLLADHALLVPPGDPAALADALARLASDGALVTELRVQARALADAVATPDAIVRPLLRRLDA
jgi:glycosyltransferase involved in cell wall biosynthesis